MNKEQFEQMLGGEAEAVRAKYASLVGDVRAGAPVAVDVDRRLA